MLLAWPEYGISEDWSDLGVVIVSGRGNEVGVGPRRSVLGRQVSRKSWGIAGEFGPEATRTAGTKREAEFPLQVKPGESPCGQERLTTWDVCGVIGCRGQRRGTRVF